MYPYSCSHHFIFLRSCIFYFVIPFGENSKRRQVDIFITYELQSF